MNDFDWARPKAASGHGPDLESPGSWKDRPIDVRAEAALQVCPQRRSQVEARRAQASVRGQALGDNQMIEPEVRRIRKADPYFPNSRYRWMGEPGRAFISAWVAYSWGLSPRPEPWDRFKSNFKG